MGMKAARPRLLQPLSGPSLLDRHGRPLLGAARRSALAFREKVGEALPAEPPDRRRIRGRARGRQRHGLATFRRTATLLGERMLDARSAPARALRAPDHPLGVPSPGRPGQGPLRRTAVRNLERAGVSRSVAMKLTGHKTESVYRRYAIVSEGDLAHGVAKLAALHEEPGAPEGRVIDLAARSRQEVGKLGGIRRMEAGCSGLATR